MLQAAAGATPSSPGCACDPWAAAWTVDCKGSGKLRGEEAANTHSTPSLPPPLPAAAAAAAAVFPAVSPPTAPLATVLDTTTATGVDGMPGSLAVITCCRIQNGTEVNAMLHTILHIVVHNDMHV